MAKATPRYRSPIYPCWETAGRRLTAIRPLDRPVNGNTVTTHFTTMRAGQRKPSGDSQIGGQTYTTQTDYETRRSPKLAPKLKRALHRRNKK